MTKIITFIAVLVCGLVAAQTNYETEMAKGLELWSQGNTAEASATFEKITASDSAEWLPNYYVALINTNASFQTENQIIKKAYLDKAQNALDVELKKDNQNAELLVVQGLIYTGWIVLNPQQNGRKYASKASISYEKAYLFAPENPRVVFSKAEFEMGTAKYLGMETAPMCEQIAKSISLFESFKPLTPFHPNWGLDRAKEALLDCK